ncbi:MAG TPA: thioesterase domain-containing protein, partial [Bryobacteraceae bacterium]|nr:thioesterase domain-containing protein [Bryobacteraceae bacterium]
WLNNIDRGSPLFLLHPVGGGVSCYRHVIASTKLARPVYGIQSPMLFGGAGQGSLEELAARYMAKIRTIQPTGPYSLAGWSIGGLLAFEIARQLEGVGECTDHLLLIDSYPMKTWRQYEPRDLNDSTELLAFAHDLLGGDFVKAGCSAECNDQLIAEIAEKGGIEVAQCQRLFDVFRYHLRIAQSYTPRPISGPVVVLQASESLLDAEAAWSAAVSGGVRVRRIESEHYTILNADNAPAVAAVLEAEFTAVHSELELAAREQYLLALGVEGGG